jgi:hypothetical protein
MAVVYANQTASVSWSGGKTLLKKDQAWDADSGLVRERPDLFTDEPEKVAGRQYRPVERATRAPGEMRDVRGPGRPKLPRDADGNIIRD